ncbi:uncharacterized protein LOC116413319 [Galleria mellonella]|uniref:Uncharacterized protein LOC116413319 n=1 Tax=Galleria mellonella TaxID=7137 RepID=A0A6J3C1S6_GALME|nr:uncharacterized protein LOC116413319 [Galleria mellonella]
MAKCGGCGKFLSSLTSDSVVCCRCKSCYHRDCVRLNRNSKIIQDWTCPSCNSKLPRQDNTDTPVKGLEASVVEPPASTETTPKKNIVDAALLEMIRLEVQSAISSQIPVSVSSSFEKEFADLKKDISLIRELKESVEFMSKEFELIKSEFHNNREKIKTLTEDNNILKSNVSDLSVRLALLEQYTRQQNIEITGIPENKSENLVKTVLQLGTVISSGITDKDVISVSRIRKVNNSSNRPRSVVVKLSDIRVRDEILAKVVKYNKTHADNKLNSHHLGYSGAKSSVYISEHLSPLNKAIHAETRRIAREKGYKYVWVRDGRILIRKNDECPAKQIKNMEMVRLL